MARVAVPLLFAFIALLGFIGWMVTTRRARQRATAVEATRELIRYQNIVQEIHHMAREARDIDPSAALIDIRITEFEQKLREIR